MTKTRRTFSCEIEKNNKKEIISFEVAQIRSLIEVDGVDYKNQWNILINGQYDITMLLNALYILLHGSNEEIEKARQDLSFLLEITNMPFETIEFINVLMGRYYGFGLATSSNANNKFASMEMQERFGGGDLMILCAKLPDKSNKFRWHVSVLWVKRDLQDSSKPTLDVPRSYPLSTHGETLQRAADKFMKQRLDSSKLFMAGPAMNMNNANTDTDSQGNGGIKTWMAIIDDQSMFIQQDGTYKLRANLESDAGFHKGVLNAIFMPISQANQIFNDPRQTTNAMAALAIRFVGDQLKKIDRRASRQRQKAK